MAHIVDASTAETPASLFAATLAQNQLFTARQSLDLHFAFQGRGFIRAGLAIQQFYRRPATRVFGALAGVMRSEAFFEVVGDAAVKGFV